jgi:hypothetical protein
MIRSTRELWSWMQKDGFFPLGNEAQKKHLSFVPVSMVVVAGPTSRVEMNAKQRRP